MISECVTGYHSAAHISSWIQNGGWSPSARVHRATRSGVDPYLERTSKSAGARTHEFPTSNLEQRSVHLAFSLPATDSSSRGERDAAVGCWADGRRADDEGRHEWQGRQLPYIQNKHGGFNNFDCKKEAGVEHGKGGWMHFAI